ncbi:hypothetical protein K435DRAFT_418191 [Dendrothele bispora CBS 962.96]|uniref:Uncharacterized protein n=1 Tax=Dendrothele bispora (strain CBS 962.96) TaxID=1314807 RepID=A0A4S8MWZ6_DENBC|nr:hypothetical protein K435DRAFT_418191 [Dendrothele bispora CBS 962.96]
MTYNNAALHHPNPLLYLYPLALETIESKHSFSFTLRPPLIICFFFLYNWPFSFTFDTSLISACLYPLTRHSLRLKKKKRRIFFARGPILHVVYIYYMCTCTYLPDRSL